MTMESLFLLPLFLSIIFIASFFLLRHIVYMCNLKSSNAKENIFQLPPGRSGWPIIGETLDYFSNVRNGTPENFVKERKEKYSSEVFMTSLIGHPMAILSGAKGNKFLFSNEKKLVQVWNPKAVQKLFPKTNGKPINEDFITVRKLLPSLLKAAPLQKFVGIIDKLMKKQIKSYGELEETKVRVMAGNYTLAVSCRIFLGIEEPEKYDKVLSPVMDIAAGILSMGINFPGTAFNKAMKSSKVLLEELEKIIKERKIELMEKKASLKQDILSRMILATDENGQHFNEADIASYLVGLLHGGFDPIRSVLTSIMKYLAEIPEVYQQALTEQMEILESTKNNELMLLNWEGLQRMKYSWNVANEVFRVMPPVLGTFRKAITDFTYAGHMIPKGTKIHWITNSTHKDPQHFENPEKFDPSRFEGIGPSPYTFVPFGGGPRMCPGNEYTRMVILVFMHNMVTNFNWDLLIPDEKMVADPHPRPTHGLPIRLLPHKPIDLNTIRV